MKYILVGVLAGIGGIVVLFFVVAQALTDQPAAMAVVMALVFLLSVAVAVSGATINVLHARQALPSPQKAPAPVIEAQYRELPQPKPTQLPAGMRLRTVSHGLMIDQQQVYDDARVIMQLREQGFPAPRRALIERALMTTDHPRIARAMDYLASMGVVTAAVDGGKREWISEDN